MNLMSTIAMALIIGGLISAIVVTVTLAIEAIFGERNDPYQKYDDEEPWA